MLKLRNVLQWHWLRQILTHSETHADPEKVNILNEFSSNFSLLFEVAQHHDSYMPIIFCSYYPLYPPAEEVNMDYEKFQSFGQMPLTPDFLIVPSELRYFVKVQKTSFV